MKKIEFNQLTKTQLDFVFAKVTELLVGNDGIFFKDNEGKINSYHIVRFNPSIDLELIEKVLQSKGVIINVKSEYGNFSINQNNIQVNENTKSLALIKWYILQYLNGEKIVEIPKSIK